MTYHIDIALDQHHLVPEYNIINYLNWKRPKLRVYDVVINGVGIVIKKMILL